MAMAGTENMEVLESYRRIEGRYHHACQVGKILSAGGMIGTALLFPIAHVDGLPFRALTLTIFALSLITFLALHLEPFIRYGRYTAALALFILLVVVLPGGPSNKSDIIPWLPLYVVFACLLTAAIHDIPFRITRYQYPVVPQVYRDPEFALSSAPRRGRRASSEWSEPRPPSESYRNDPSNFQHMGPGSGSSRSVQSGSDATEYTFRNLDGAQRDPQADLIYGNSNFELGRHTSGDFPSATMRGADAYEAAADMELSQVRPSQDSALESRAPLLGSHE
ncbi:hypothetical protein CONLIGDRAFT_7902 [Coniochaeta ligniaria NRRL 30616]|uniref:Uncharacterized protein n=1 Tax=Coniochaeta ligniaria NRRL 30616 TaxID=1408157 RepID=A0A1J7JYM9_9PEZI|nr:hypothetical protein CONLIGDRAFT_7902 [Coniochaeta ligniaria NRRL 30616]